MAPVGIECSAAQISCRMVEFNNIVYKGWLCHYDHNKTKERLKFPLENALLGTFDIVYCKEKVYRHSIWGKTFLHIFYYWHWRSLSANYFLLYDNHYNRATTITILSFLRNHNHSIFFLVNLIFYELYLAHLRRSCSFEYRYLVCLIWPSSTWLIINSRTNLI